MKAIFAPLCLLLVVAQAPAQSSQRVKDSFVGKWYRDAMTIEGKRRQNIRLHTDGAIWFDSTDQNGNLVRQSGTWSVVNGQVKLLISPKRAGVKFDVITMRRLNKTTLKAVTWNNKVWGRGPLLFTWGGSVTK